MTDNNGLNPMNEISEEELNGITGGCVAVEGGESSNPKGYGESQGDGGSDSNPADDRLTDIYDGMPRTSPGTLVRVTR